MTESRDGILYDDTLPRRTHGSTMAQGPGESQGWLRIVGAVVLGLVALVVLLFILTQGQGWQYA
jgi:hypothetical protein